MTRISYWCSLCPNFAVFDGPLSDDGREAQTYLVDELGWQTDYRGWVCNQPHEVVMTTCWRSDCKGVAVSSDDAEGRRYLVDVLGWAQYEDGRWQCPAHPVAQLPWVFQVADALHVSMVAARRGTTHEGHRGWGMNDAGPGLVQCECGEPLDEIIQAYDSRPETKKSTETATDG